MMWITWRRYRGRIILLALYIVALVFAISVVGHDYQSALHNFVHHTDGATRSSLGTADVVGDYLNLGILLLPLFIGVVLGTPIVASELDAKTSRLAWSQSVSRGKWLLCTWATLAGLTLILMTVIALIAQGWAVRWGAGPIQPVQMTISGVTPIALSLFTLTFGMFVGVVVRRFISPYATSGLCLAAIMIIMPTEVVGALAPRVVVPESGLGSPTNQHVVGPNPWLISTGYRRLTGARGVEAVDIYQPANHYWILQWREAGIYVAAAGALLGLSLWTVRRWRV